MGCLAKVNITTNKKTNLGPKTIDYIFIGYFLDRVTYFWW